MGSILDMQQKVAMNQKNVPMTPPSLSSQNDDLEHLPRFYDVEGDNWMLLFVSAEFF